MSTSTLIAYEASEEEASSAEALLRKKIQNIFIRFGLEYVRSIFTFTVKEWDVIINNTSYGFFRQLEKYGAEGSSPPVKPSTPIHDNAGTEGIGNPGTAKYTAWQKEEAALKTYREKYEAYYKKTGINNENAMREAIRKYLEANPKGTGITGPAAEKPITIRTTMTPDKMAAAQKKLTPIYPDKFMDFDHPLAPWVSVQFRTTFTSGVEITNDSLWEEVVFNPNSFFQKLDVEDNKGVKRITLELFDQYYTTLENIIMKCILATQLSNKLAEQKKGSSSGNPFEFIINTASFVNLRIRFGYANQEPRQKKQVIDTVNPTEFKKRTKELAHLPVVKTPWIYCQILGVKQNFTDEGLRMNITAISSSSSFLNNAKMIKKFAVIRGTPKTILKDVGDILTKASSAVSEGADKEEGGVRFYNFYDKVDGYDTASDLSQQPLSKTPLEIQLGDQPKVDDTGKTIEEYKSVRELLDDIVGKIPPLKIMEDGSFKELYSTEDTTGERFSYYQYVVEENSKGAKIKFYYNNPDTLFMSSDEKIYLRTYQWRDTPDTVVKSLSIQTETDFAQMNMPIFTVTGAEGAKKVSVVYNAGSSSSTTDTITQELNIGPTGTTDLGIINTDGFDFSFVSQARSLPGDSTGPTVADLAVNKFLQNINSSIFRGTIELAGDPFFLFDTALQPYQYLIKVVVMRPTAGSTKYGLGKGDSPISYVSGYYTITNIKHSIGADGYSTTLEVMRWPSLFKTVTE